MFKFIKNIGYSSNGSIVYLCEDSNGGKFLGTFWTEANARYMRFIRKSALLAVTKTTADGALVSVYPQVLHFGSIKWDISLDKTFDVETLVEYPDNRPVTWDAYEGVQTYFSNVPLNLPDRHTTEALGSITPTIYPYTNTGVGSGSGSGTGVTTVPAVSKTAVANVSGQTTATLSGIVSNAAPSGTVLEWHTGIVPSVLNKVADPSSVDSGTYYPFFYDASTGSYSPAGTAVTVTITATSFFSSPLTWIQENPLLFAGIALVALLVINYVVLPAMGMEQWFGGDSVPMKGKSKALKRLRRG